jgi:hypothetical protein
MRFIVAFLYWRYKKTCVAPIVDNGLDGEFHNGPGSGFQVPFWATQALAYVKKKVSRHCEMDAILLKTAGRSFNKPLLHKRNGKF